MAASNRSLFILSKPFKSTCLVFFIVSSIILHIMSVSLCDETHETKSILDKTWKEPHTRMNFIQIDGDCYKMGNRYKGKWYFHELPQHKVCLSSYYMGVTEVTNAEFRKFKPEHKNGYINNTSLDEEQFPVVNVGLDEAKEFAKWLTQKHHGQYRFRLPSEAEWEYACREGITTDQYWVRKDNDSCLYANLIDHSPSKEIGPYFLNACLDKHMTLAPVGSYLPNKLGLFDMLGNVWEWCLDSYDIYAYRKLPRKNPVNTKASPYHAIRGGSWQSVANDTRCSKRKYTIPDAQFEGIGFRLIMITTQ